MKLTVVLAVLIGILVLACSTVTPAPAEPTPNIDATVEARLKEEKASEPTVQTQPTTTPVPPPTLTLIPVTYTFQSLNDIGFTSYKDNVRDDDFVLQLSKGNFDISQIKKRLSDDDYDNVWFGEITIHKAGLFDLYGKPYSEPLWVILSDDPIESEREQRIKYGVDFLGNNYKKTLANLFLICNREWACDYVIETLSNPVEEARVKQLLAVTPTPYPTTKPRVPTAIPTVVPTPTPRPIPILTVAVEPLMDEFKQDFVTAMEKYDGYELTVQGRINGVGTFGDKAFVRIAHYEREIEWQTEVSLWCIVERTGLSPADLANWWNLNYPMWGSTTVTIQGLFAKSEIADHNGFQVAKIGGKVYDTRLLALDPCSISVQSISDPTPTPTPTPVPTPFQWPNPPTGQAELSLSSAKGSVGDEITAFGRGFTNTGYAVIWIDGDDDGLIDDWEYVFATNIKATEREFSHIFIVDSNFQGTSHINAMGGDGMAVNPAMNPTFTVPGTYATPVPTPTPVPVPGNITIESSRKIVGSNVYLLTQFKNDSSDLLNMSATLDAYDSSGARLIGNDIYVSTLVPAKSSLLVEGSRYIYNQANLNAVAHHASKYDLTTLTFSSPDWVSYSEVNEDNNPYFKISNEWITNNTDQEIVVKALKRNWVEFVYPELPEGPYYEWPGTTGDHYWTVQTIRLPGGSKMLIPFDTYGVTEWRVDSSP